LRYDSKNYGFDKEGVAASLSVFDTHVSLTADNSDSHEPSNPDEQPPFVDCFAIVYKLKSSGNFVMRTLNSTKRYGLL
jgi:hypothetical protein